MVNFIFTLGATNQVSRLRAGEADVEVAGGEARVGELVERQGGIELSALAARVGLAIGKPQIRYYFCLCEFAGNLLERNSVVARFDNIQTAVLHASPRPPHTPQELLAWPNVERLRGAPHRRRALDLYEARAGRA